MLYICFITFSWIRELYLTIYSYIYVFILIILCKYQEIRNSNTKLNRKSFPLPKYESAPSKLIIKYPIFSLNDDKMKIQARLVRARIELGLIISIAEGKDRSTHLAIGLRWDLRAIGSAARIISTFCIPRDRSTFRQKRRNDIIYRYVIYCYDGVTLFRSEFFVVRFTFLCVCTCMYIINYKKNINIINYKINYICTI